MSTQIEMLKNDLEKNLPAMVAREEIAKYTGGMFAPASMAIYDSRGTGVKDPVTMGRKVGYLKSNLIDWIINNVNKKSLMEN